MKHTICLFIVIMTVNFQARGDTREAYEDSQVIQLVQSHIREGIVWLGRGNHTFLSLYLEPAETGSNRVAIILHSMGMHADWPELISPLRRQLPMQGWASLSVQLPLLEPRVGHAEYGGTFNLANERIRTAVRYLQERGYSNIVLIGYGFGATSAVRYLTEYTSVINAFVGISMQPHPFLKPKYDIVEELSRLNLPILDVYGGRDISGVVKSADDRRLAANKAGNSLYNQVVIRGANHYFTDRDSELANIIVEWLDRTVSSAGDD